MKRIEFYKIKQHKNIYYNKFWYYYKYNYTIY